MYYCVSGQLIGSGNITCKVQMKITRHYGNGTYKSRSKTYASGGYSICDAQAENY